MMQFQLAPEGDSVKYPSCNMKGNSVDVSRLLAEVRDGKAGSENRLFSALYTDLKRIARAQMRNERRDHSLSPSALVNEAYLRMVPGGTPWACRSHFFGHAAEAMRCILVDWARARRTRKRGGGLERIGLEDIPPLFTEQHVERILTIHSVLEKLEQWDARQAAVVKLRFFAGLTNREIADLLNVSEKTVKRDWAMARAWIQTQLEPEP